MIQLIKPGHTVEDNPGTLHTFMLKHGSLTDLGYMSISTKLPNVIKNITIQIRNSCC